MTLKSSKNFIVFFSSMNIQCPHLSLARLLFMTLHLANWKYQIIDYLVFTNTDILREREEKHLMSVEH